MPHFESVLVDAKQTTYCFDRHLFNLIYNDLTVDFHYRQYSLALPVEFSLGSKLSSSIKNIILQQSDEIFKEEYLKNCARNKAIKDNQADTLSSSARSSTEKGVDSTSKSSPPNSRHIDYPNQPQTSKNDNTVPSSGINGMAYYLTVLDKVNAKIQAR